MIPSSQESPVRPPPIGSQPMYYHTPAFGYQGRYRHENAGAYPEQRPRRRADFEIAIVCALPLGYDAVRLLFDLDWSASGLNPGKAPGDRNTYTIGRIGRHDVVVALLPGMGKVNAAGVAAGLRLSFPNIKIAILTGVCGGAPYTRHGEEIVLGDVIIGDDIVQHDFGRLYPDHFAIREGHGDRLSRPNSEIRAFLATLGSQSGLESLQQQSVSFLRDIQAEAVRKNRRLYKYAGATKDRLFSSSYRHRHYNSSQCCCSQSIRSSNPACETALSSPCTETLCSESQLISRSRLELRRIREETGEAEDTPPPAIFMGRVASGDTVMKSAEDRDRITREKNVIAFEMEGAGLWAEVPCIVVKGVCNYADSHKNKGWQDYAAATAASATKAILGIYTSTDRQSSLPDTITDGTILNSSKRVNSLLITDTSGPSRNRPMFSNPLISPNLSSRTRYHVINFFYRSALRSLPNALQTRLSSQSSEDILQKKWEWAMKKVIEGFPEAPPHLSNTSPFNRFIEGTEKCIWYQVQECDREPHDGNDSLQEYEETPLILLRAHEIDKERRKIFHRTRAWRYRNTMPTKQNTEPPKQEMIFLFYIASKDTQEDEDPSPFQAFLWSLISQFLLWQPDDMSPLPEWIEISNDSIPSFRYIPRADQLKMLFRSLLKKHKIPVVITICHAQWLTQYQHTQSVQFLSELYSGHLFANIPVYLIASAVKTSPVLPPFGHVQILNRDTESDECLGDLAFEGQYLRRDEVAAADKGTNDWIWFHASFCSWCEQPSGILWIEGKAGSGKSVLAKTIRFKLAQSDGFALQGVPLPPISDWFFSSRHGTVNKSHVTFLRSILGQILKQNRHAFHHYAAVYRKKKEDQRAWNFEDYEAVLKELAVNGLPAICIVDAMDESDDSAGSYDLRSRIISLMEDICCTQGSRIRFIVLSRYMADIDRSLHRYSKNAMLFRIWLEKENVSDITTLVENALNTIRSAMRIYESDEDEEIGNYHPGHPVDTARSESVAMDRMRKYLIENADGVILWVILATQALIGKIRRGFYSLELLESELKTLPQGIIDFYKLTLRDLESRYSQSELERTRTALMWVVGASSIKPLTLNELYEALCIPTHPVIQFNIDPIAQSPLRIHAKSWLGFYRQLRVRCGPFLEVIIPETQEFGLSFSQNTKISPHFTVQLLHRTVKDFLHNQDESGPLAFTQVEADDFVRNSTKTYLELVLPKYSTTYCPVPAAGDKSLQTTIEGMAHYLEKKYLLEFVITALPEHEIVPYLLIFETSVHPPLIEQRDCWPWDEALRTISYQYFEYMCREGLVEAMTNLLSIASNLLLSWPTLLRYGPLASALQRCSDQFSKSVTDLATLGNNGRSISNRRLIIEAIEMMTQFSRREQDLNWECPGVYGRKPPLIPSIVHLRNTIEEVQIASGKRLGTRLTNQNSQVQPEPQGQPELRDRPFCMTQRIHTCQLPVLRLTPPDPEYIVANEGKSTTGHSFSNISSEDEL